jgi:hypothetical protein
MPDNFFLQFILELFRALLVDGLSGHVRRRIARWFRARGADNGRAALLGAHRRNRDRLLHKLRTEMEEDL